MNLFDENLIPVDDVSLYDNYDHIGQGHPRVFININYVELVVSCLVWIHTAWHSDRIRYSWK